MQLNTKIAHIYSRLGQRGAIFGMGVTDIAEKDDRFIVLTADLATLSGLERYQRLYPQQFLNIGIAEQNMLGIAAGLCAEEFHPIVTTYATFLTMRACEQIRHYMGYMSLPIVAIGGGAGLCQGFVGNTHYTIEDISMMRAIPNLSIYSPADAASAVGIFKMAVERQRPTYIRLTGNLNCPIVYNNDVDFEQGGSHLVYGNAPKDIVIMACGTMVNLGIKAAEILEQQGKETTVVDMYSLKPADVERIKECAGAKLLVSIEEHNRMGGLGAIIAEVLTTLPTHARLLRLGIHDSFDVAGDYEGLLLQNRLTPDLIVEDILNV